MATYLFLATFLVGLLAAVRLMFFGAERLRPAPGALPLRRSEPAVIAFLVAFGLSAYLMHRNAWLGAGASVLAASAIGLVVAVVATWLAIAAARMTPEHDPEDPRYVLQGHVAVVTVDIPAGGEGEIRIDGTGSSRRVRARDIVDGAILAGQEVCIERIDDGVAYVELWARVEERL